MNFVYIDRNADIQIHEKLEDLKCKASIVNVFLTDDLCTSDSTEKIDQDIFPDGFELNNENILNSCAYFLDFPFQVINTYSN